MPTPILITLEEAAWKVVLGEPLRPETRATIEAGQVSKDEKGRPVREVAATIEDLQQVESVLFGFNRSLIPGKDAPPATMACYRALEEVRGVILAVRK